MRKIALALFACFITLCTNAQQVAYVNTDNLIVRDIPTLKYAVILVLHAPCMITIEEFDKGYKGNKPVNDNFYQVYLHYKINNMTYNVYGWVQKKYLVNSLNKIDQSKFDTVNLLHFTKPSSTPYVGKIEADPNKNNRVSFPYPEYKGGDVSITKKISKKRPIELYDYRWGWGGCFYYDDNRKRVYVDSRNCQ